MLYRNRKPGDMNEGKWISPGGKVEEGETPDECVVREVLEETGLRLRSWTFHGVIEFRSDEYQDEDMYLYSSSDFVPADEEAARIFINTGRYEPPECREGRNREARRDNQGRKSISSSGRAGIVIRTVTNIKTAEFRPAQHQISTKGGAQ